MKHADMTDKQLNHALALETESMLKRLDKLEHDDLLRIAEKLMRRELKQRKRLEVGK